MLRIIFVLLLLLLCAENLILSFSLCVCTPRALAYVNAQPPWHGVIKRTIGGSLARSCRPRCRAAPAAACCCYYYYLLLLGLSAAAANDRCAVVDSAVRRVSGDFRLLLCVCTRLVRSRTSMRTHQGTESSNKRTIGGSLACSWPPPLPRRRRCCVLLLLLLGLPAVAANNRCAVLAYAVCEFVYFV